MNLIKLCFLSLLTMVLTACGGEGGGLPSQGGGDGGETVPAIVSLQVTPATATVPVGFEQQYLAEVLLDDGSVLDVTSNPSLNWSSSDPAIASIDKSGRASGLSSGRVTITASGVANGVPVERKVSLTITNAVVTQLQVTPANDSVPVGMTKQYTAIAFLSDGSTRDVTNDPALSWSSYAPSIATISNKPGTKGLATGLTPGDTIITASGTANNTQFSASVQLTVSDTVVTQLQITPASGLVPVGLGLPYTATAILSDGSSLDVTNEPALSWSSSDARIASISNDVADKGKATGILAGNVTITASGEANGQLFSATAQLAVTNATVIQLQVSPTHATMTTGTTQGFAATAILSDGSSLDVTANTALSWSSNSTLIATVSNNTDTNSKGVVTAIAPGEATITASGTANGAKFTGTALVTVNPMPTITSIEIAPDPVTVGRRQKQQLTATAIYSDSSTQDLTTYVDWQTDNTDIATVSGGLLFDKGLLTGIEVGTTRVTASSNGITDTVEVTVNPWVTITGIGDFSVPDVARNWSDADAYCKSLSYDGGTWRLPTMAELIGLYNAYPNNRTNTQLRWLTNRLFWSNELSSSGVNTNFYKGLLMTEGAKTSDVETTLDYVTCFR